MAQSALHVRPAAPDDAARLLAWRNDGATRAQSRHGAEIGWDAHCQWLARMLADDGCVFLIGEVAGEAVGTVRFNRGEGGVWEVSIVMAPAARGRGLGGVLLGAGIGHLRTLYPMAEILAAVRAGNQASEALFQRAGFVPSPSPEAGFAHFLLQA